MLRAFLACAACGTVVCAGCDRGSRSTSRARDGFGPQEISIRVPAALSIARGIGALSVSIDPASLADTTVQADRGTFIGVEAEVFVFPVGQARAAARGHSLQSSADFGAVTATWDAEHDGIPGSGTKYIAEMQLVLFETDVAPGREWNPHSGHYKSLWTRTLRQAEE
ncbi:MAG TPA: hypothetical protein VGY54_16225 [Polyangiaceae bacterium]|jgi:hypothetical protein|nr:hypothetical protein [Polyangiaceae bacterium]